MDLQALDKATDYAALCAAMWPTLPQRVSEGHLWMPDPRRGDEPGARTDAFSINLETGCWADHKTGDGGNMVTLVGLCGNFDTWAKTCPAAAPLLRRRAPGSSLIKPHAAARGPEPEAGPAKNYAEELAKFERMQTDEWVQAFATAWGVRPETLRKYGACYAASRGRTAGKPVLNIGARDPKGAVVGIKSRALEPLWTSDGQARKSNNQGKVGLVGYPTSRDEADTRPLLLLEGEKDFIVAADCLSEKFLCVGNLGGAGTFKEEWAAPIREAHKKIYILYDNDDNQAGWTGARKVARKLWTPEHEIHIVYLPVVGTDVFDFLRGKEGVCEAQPPEALVEIILASKPLDPPTHHEALLTIQAHLDDEDLRRDDGAMANALYVQIKDHGGRFYHEDRTMAYLLWNRSVYPIDRSDPGWSVLHHKLTGLTVHHPVGSRVTAQVSDLAITEGCPIEASAWQARRGSALYLPLYDKEHNLLRISPDALEVVPNGTDDVVLLPDPFTKPIEFQPDSVYDAEKAEAAWDAMFAHLNLTPEWQAFVKAFALTIPMYSWCQTHPHIRFQGEAGSGKSTAFTLINAMLTGSPDSVASMTRAGMWRMGSKMPLMALDDLEAKQVRNDDDLKEFFLRATIGGHRVIGALSQETVHRQRVCCWLMSNGISPITANLPALVERIIVVPVLPKSHHSSGFYGQDVLDSVMANRQLLWNYLFRHAQGTLRLLDQGAMQAIMAALPRAQRPRLHEFFALLSVSQRHILPPSPFVLQWLSEAKDEEEESKMEGSSMVTMLLHVPAYLDAPDELMLPGAKASRGIETTTNGNLWSINLQTHELHALFQRMRRDTGLPYYPGSAQELGNELQALRPILPQYGVTLIQTMRRMSGGPRRCWTIEIQLDHAAPISKSRTAAALKETE